MTRPIPMTDLERQTERMNELWRRLESELAATFEGCSARVRVIVPPKIAGVLVFERGALSWAPDFSASTAITSAPRHVRIAATQHVGALRRALLEDRDSLAAALSDATKALERDILDLTSDGPAPVVTKRRRKK